MTDACETKLPKNNLKAYDFMTWKIWFEFKFGFCDLENVQINRNFYDISVKKQKLVCFLGIDDLLKIVIIKDSYILKLS